MARKLAEILSSSRRQYFTGREKELQLFKSIVQQPHLSTFLLYIYGPGGQGKTTLSREYAAFCKEQEIHTIQIDGRDINAAPDDMLATLQQVLQTNDNVFDALQAKGDKVVLFIDTYEKLTPIDDWLRQEFLPQMPDNVLTVLTGRKAPSKNWVLDQGWQQLMKTLQVRNLSPAESRQFLIRRNVPESEVEKILDFTHGHPLALNVVADTYAQQPGRQFNLDESPDMVRTLLESFVQKAPSPAHRIALEISAIVYITTESV
jgi:replication-associated recombination protein RarA